MIAKNLLCESLKCLQLWAFYYLGSLYEWQKPMLEDVNEWVARQEIDITHGINIVLRDYVDEEFSLAVIAKNFNQ